MKLKLFLTFDHELPLGKLKTTYKDSLFDPTKKLIDVANEVGVKVTLFTDILCGLRFKEWDYTNFYLPYKNQLEKALNTGHDVQLHIHPHWLTTRFESGIYYPSTDYALNCFKNNSHFNGIHGIIKSGIDCLNDICIPVKADYKCIAYRAGGFNISPATSEIFTALENEGIRYDSSIARGHYFKSLVSEVDFRELPNESNWYVNPENYHISGNSTGILEVPVATIPKTIFELPTLFKLKRYSYRAPISHGEVMHTKNNVTLISKLLMLQSSRILSFDNYTLSLDYLLHIIEYNVNKYKSSETIMLSIISHPKSMGEYSFELMKKFVIEVKKKYPDAEFLTFSELNAKC